MTQLEANTLPATDRRAAAAWLPALLVLFIGSGCAALIYEVVWFQLLQLSIGSSAVSLGVLLGVYMGGMCLGSLLLPRYVSPREHPLRSQERDSSPFADGCERMRQCRRSTSTAPKNELLHERR